jgi:hypothetical protein
MADVMWQFHDQLAIGAASVPAALTGWWCTSKETQLELSCCSWYCDQEADQGATNTHSQKPWTQPCTRVCKLALNAVTMAIISGCMLISYSTTRSSGAAVIDLDQEHTLSTDSI